MRILDPQTAHLPLSEVHTFLSSLPSYTIPPKIGAYPPVNTTGYKNIREDLNRYLTETTPHVIAYNDRRKAEAWAERVQAPSKDEEVEAQKECFKRVIRRLKPFGLEKMEIQQLIDLGVGVRDGMPKGDGQHLEVLENGNGEEEVEMVENGQGLEDEQSGLSKHLFTLVVEEVEERFPAEHSGEEKIEEILRVLREELGGLEVNGAGKREGMAGEDGDADLEDETMMQEEETNGVKREVDDG